MVTIKKENSNFIFEVKGLHKVWAFKNQITIPAADIVSVHQNMDALSDWKGLRMPGTSIPFIITAGTYVWKDRKDFWDVVNEKNCIVVELKDAEYNHLIIEVENPEEAMQILRP